jgi:hypothetical protein
VVPEHLLARFMSWFRVLGTVSAACYSFFIFPYSGTHGTQIFLGAACLYMVGFGLMCWNVREGKYPDPPKISGGKDRAAMIATYGEECHSNRIYLYLWLTTFVGCIGGGTFGFNLFLQKSVGLDMAHIGMITGTTSVMVSVLILGSGWLADRYHPMRVVFAAQVLGWITFPLSFIWIFWQPGAHAYWQFHLPLKAAVAYVYNHIGPLLAHLPLLGQYIHTMDPVAPFQVQKVFLYCILTTIGISAPIAALGGMWDPVMLMRIFPRSRYGQFCSTNAVWRSVGGIIGAPLVGLFLGAIIAPKVGSRERAYAYMPVFQVGFTVLAAFFFLKYYQTWKRLGADDYVAPVTESGPVKTSVFVAMYYAACLLLAEPLSWLIGAGVGAPLWYLLARKTGLARAPYLALLIDVVQLAAWGYFGWVRGARRVAGRYNIRHRQATIACFAVFSLTLYALHVLFNWYDLSDIPSRGVLVGGIAAGAVVWALLAYVLASLLLPRENAAPQLEVERPEPGLEPVPEAAAAGV